MTTQGFANITSADRVRLAKILGRLGSEHPGERDAAALAAVQFVRKLDSTFIDILLPCQHQARPITGSSSTAALWRTLAEQCLTRAEELSDWEARFLTGILEQRSLSDKQSSRLYQIADSLGLVEPA